MSTAKAKAGELGEAAGVPTDVAGVKELLHIKNNPGEAAAQAKAKAKAAAAPRRRLPRTRRVARVAGAAARAAKEKAGAAVGGAKTAAGAAVGGARRQSAARRPRRGAAAGAAAGKATEIAGRESWPSATARRASRRSAPRRR